MSSSKAQKECVSEGCWNGLIEQFEALKVEQDPVNAVLVCVSGREWVKIVESMAVMGCGFLYVR